MTAPVFVVAPLRLAGARARRCGRRRRAGGPPRCHCAPVAGGRSRRSGRRRRACGPAAPWPLCRTADRFDVLIATWECESIADTARDGSAGPAEGRTHGRRRGDAHRGRCGRDRAVGGPTQRGSLAAGSGGEGARTVGQHRPGGRQAVAPRTVSRPGCAGRHRRRRLRGSRPPTAGWRCTRMRRGRWPVPRCRTPARSSRSSGQRVASRRRSWPSSAGPGLQPWRSGPPCCVREPQPQPAARWCWPEAAGGAGPADDPSPRRMRRPPLPGPAPCHRWRARCSHR